MSDFLWLDCSTPGFPILHYFPEFAQTHVHWADDVIQPSYPLSPPYPHAFNLSLHQGLSQLVGFLHQVDKILELQLQHQSFQWIFRVDFLQDWLVWFSCCPKDAQESSPAPQFKASILRHSAFFTVQLSQSFVTTGKTITLTIWTSEGRVMSLLFNTLFRFVIVFPQEAHVFWFHGCSHYP